MKKGTLLIILIVSLCLCPSAWPADQLTLLADYASFCTPKGTTYTEFYCGLYQNQLKFIGSDTLEYLYAGVFISVTLYNSAGAPVDSASTYFLSRIKESSEQSKTSTRLFDYLLVRVPPGRYRAELTAIDDVSKAVGKVTLNDVVVPDFRSKNMVSSDLQLAYDIRPLPDDSNATNPHLAKEGYLVIPNPTGTYQTGVDSVIHVYSELYWPEPLNPACDSFVVGYQVKDSVGNLIYDFGAVKYGRPGNSAVITRELDATHISPGQYYLLLQAIDLNSRQQTAAIKRFAVIDPTLELRQPSSDDINTMVNIAWYFMSDAEKARVNDLTIEGKKNFVKQFWRDMDIDPSNPQNLTYDEAVRRYFYANKNFSTIVDPPNGWKTDRGRVYIMYGPYDSETELILPGSIDPVIKWDYYKLEGGVIFIFLDDVKAGIKGYRLVHSTHSREISNSDWEEALRKENPEEGLDRSE